jgi:hypothetical protein
MSPFLHQDGMLGSPGLHFHSFIILGLDGDEFLTICHGRLPTEKGPRCLMNKGLSGSLGLIYRDLSYLDSNPRLHHV